MINLFNIFNSFTKNPIGMVMRMFNVPQNLNDPQAIIQHLLNSGQISQDTVNQAMGMRDNPMFKNLF